MKLASHLWQSRHGIFYIRYVFDGVEVKRSLRTRSPKFARSLAYKLNNMNVDDLIKKLNNGQTLDLTFKTGDVEIVTDGSEKEHLQALDLLKLHHSMKNKAVDASSNHTSASVEQLSSNQSHAQYNSRIIRISLEEAVNEYLEERKPTVKPRTFGTWRSEFGQLIKGLGKSTVVSDIDEEMYVNFRSRKIDILAPSSQDSKNNTYKNFFDWCKERRRIESNPVTSLKIGKFKRKEMQADRGRERLPYDKNDLNTLFNDKAMHSLKKPCLFWMPLIAFFSGARSEEIANIKVDSIQAYDTGKYQMTIDESKTYGGIRSIPIHGSLIQLGFLDYVNDVARIWGKASTLFPYMTPVNGRLTHRFSQDFGKHRRMLGIDASRDFHSLRTTVIGVLKHNLVDSEMRREFVGHESNEKQDVHLKNYASKTKFMIQQLETEVLNKLDYKFSMGYEFALNPCKPSQFSHYLRNTKRKKLASKTKATKSIN